MLSYSHHHVSINTLSLEAALGFYKLLGFVESHRYSDDAVTIVHLSGGGGLIEVFCYADSTLSPSQECDVPHSKKIGIEHFSLHVDDIHAAHDDLKEFAVCEVSAGRTGIDYFFISDPDGNRIEIVRDVRSFSLNANEGNSQK